MTWTRTDAGHGALGWPRWQLPDGTTMLPYQSQFLGRLPWMVIRHHLLDQDEVMVMAGDDVIVTKAGQQTHG